MQGSQFPREGSHKRTDSVQIQPKWATSELGHGSFVDILHRRLVVKRGQDSLHTLFRMKKNADI